MSTFNLQNKNNPENESGELLPIDLPLLNNICTNILISWPVPLVERFFSFTFEDSKHIESITRNQNASEEWHRLRKMIFTSSNFGNLCKRRKPLELTFFENMWSKNLSHLISIQHGLKEENAKLLYIKKTGTKYINVD